MPKKKARKIGCVTLKGKKYEAKLSGVYLGRFKSERAAKNVIKETYLIKNKTNA